MKYHQRKIAMKLARTLLPAREFKKILKFKINDVGFGYDPFGMERETTILLYSLCWYLYTFWFRVESFGYENLPNSGRVMVTPNHSGVLPYDGMMVAIDIAKKLDQPRIVRGIVDEFMGFLPFLNTLFYRAGQVVGARRNFHDLLRNEEMVIVFPEGAKGTGKPFRDRYQLLRFNVGFIEIALIEKAPIIPVAVIGAEEQAPMLTNIKPLARLLNFPYFPVTPFFPWFGPLGALPLPTKYRIYYGEPIRFHEEYSADAIKDPEIVRKLADKVQAQVQALIDRGRGERKSIFGLAG